MDLFIRDMSTRGTSSILKKGYEFTKMNLLFGLKMMSHKLIFSLIPITHFMNKIMWQPLCMEDEAK